MAQAFNRTSNATVGTLIPNYWSTKLVDNLYANLYYYQFGDPRPLPRNFGTSIKFPRIISKNLTWTEGTADAASHGLAVATSALSSGFVSGSLRQFDFAYRHTDIVLMTALSDVVDLSVAEISRQGAKKVDTTTRDAMSASGLFVGGSAAANSQSVKTTSILKTSDLLKAAVLLDSYNNPRPADGHYPFITHPKAMYDLQSTLSQNAWLMVNQYNPAGLEKLYRGEMGKIFGVKLVTSSNVKRLAAGLSVASSSGYRSHMFAPNAFYTTTLEGGRAAEVIIKPLGSGGTADPTNKIATVGAKLYFAVIPITAVGGQTEHRIARIIHGSNVV